MGIFNFISSLNVYSDENFERQLKKYDKEYGSKHLDFKLDMAYSHASVKSAFWWFENSIIKPNTGSDADIMLLHAKFKHSLEKKCDDSRDITRAIQSKFVSCVLPDIDYSKFKLKNKEECVNLIMEDYDKLRNNNNRNNHISPFITSTYYLIYNIEKMVTEDGKILRDENGKTAYYVWLKNFLNSIDEKFTNYDVISL